MPMRGSWHTWATLSGAVHTLAGSYRGRVQMMRTPDGEWTVEVLRVGARECFRVRRAIRPGQFSRSGWAPTGVLSFSVEEVRTTVGDRFADLELADVWSRSRPA